MSDSENLSPVEYEFFTDAFKDPQSREPTADSWRVLSIHIHECLSEPYVCEVRLVREHGTQEEAQTLLGSSCSIGIHRDAAGKAVAVDRWVRGIASQVVYRGTQHHSAIVDLQLVPALWAASRRIDSRIFQDETATEIVERILRQTLEPYGRSPGFAKKYQRKANEFQRREYCVQYDESDLDFISRLLHEEGLTYYFDFDENDSTEIVRVMEANNDCKPVARQSPDDAVGFVERGSAVPVEALFSLSEKTGMQHTGVTVMSYDWTKAVDPLKYPQAGEDSDREIRELYISRPRVIKANYAQDQDGKMFEYTQPHGTTMATTHWEIHGAQKHVLSGTGNLIGLIPGRVLEVEQPDGGTAEYLLVRVEHEGRAADGVIRGVEQMLAGASPVAQYENRFTCIPLAVPYRPPLAHRRPRIVGPQTARVVGPASEEVYTDEHGRIKVRFHWDRATKIKNQEILDEKRSCWVRVGQMWAGPNYGTMFIPRIGMEVIVQFLDGDPDQPLVVGTVHNGANHPPYDLPEDRTKSWIYTRTSPWEEVGSKSQSAPTGGRKTQGQNELTFEDVRDHEEIYIRSQKNLNMVAYNNQTTWIGDDWPFATRDASFIKNKKEHRFLDLPTLDLHADPEKGHLPMQSSVGPGNRITLIGPGADKKLATEDDAIQLKPEGGNDFKVVMGNKRTVIEGDENVLVRGDRIIQAEGDILETRWGDTFSSFIGRHNKNYVGVRLDTYLGLHHTIFGGHKHSTIFGKSTERIMPPKAILKDVVRVLGVVMQGVSGFAPLQGPRLWARFKPKMKPWRSSTEAMNWAKQTKEERRCERKDYDEGHPFPPRVDWWQRYVDESRGSGKKVSEEDKKKSKMERLKDLTTGFVTKYINNESGKFSEIYGEEEKVVHGSSRTVLFGDKIEYRWGKKFEWNNDNKNQVIKKQYHLNSYDKMTLAGGGGKDDLETRLEIGKTANPGQQIIILRSGQSKVVINQDKDLVVETPATGLLNMKGGKGVNIDAGKGGKKMTLKFSEMKATGNKVNLIGNILVKR